MSEGRRHTILAIDDVSSNLSLINHLLRDEFRVKLANSAAKGLALAVANPPDLILLDIMMPEMDGFEAIRRLQSEVATARIPVIFVSARNGVADEEAGLSLGAVDYIHKPFSPALMLARIRAHLQASAWKGFMADQGAWLQAEVERRVGDALRRREGLACAVSGGGAVSGG